MERPTRPGDEARLLPEAIQAEQLATIGEVSAGVAQALGAPLTAIQVALDRLHRYEEAATTGTRAVELQVIAQETRRIAWLARELVGLARPLKPTLQATALNPLVRDIAELLDGSFRDAGVEVELELDEDLPRAWSDRRQLRHVLLALFMNAQRAVVVDSEAPHLIHVRTEATETRVELRISDTGIGIPPDQRGRIFLPFVSGWGGSGLGLPVARQVLHGHGGGIVLDGQHGGAGGGGDGATFLVHLDRADRIPHAE